MKRIDLLDKLRQRMLRSRRGTVAVMAAIATPIVVGFAGFGVEVGTWHTSKRTLQTAADAAANSGALERAYGGNGTAIRTAALREAGRNGFASDNEYDSVIYSPPRSGAFINDSSAVEVTLARRQNPLLAKVFVSAPVSIAARSVAAMRQVGNACVLALSPTDSGAVTNTGSTSVNMASCIVAANSNSAAAINVTGNGALTAQSLYTVGAYSQGGSSTLTLSQPAATRMWPTPDPFAATAIPNPGSCNYNSARYQNQTVTISPGTYCLGIAIGAHANVTFNPGVYVLNRGDFSVNAQAVVNCNCANGEGVTIILTSSTSANQIGRVFINGGATVNLAAPSYVGAPYRGLLFVQDGRVPSNATSASNRFNGGSNMILKGGLYFPGAEVQWSGNNATSNCIQVVARTVTFTGNSRLDVGGCPAAGVAPIQITAARLVE